MKSAADLADLDANLFAGSYRMCTRKVRGKVVNLSYWEGRVKRSYYFYGGSNSRELLGVTNGFTREAKLFFQ